MQHLLAPTTRPAGDLDSLAVKELQGKMEVVKLDQDAKLNHDF